jgi:hypothetical protein
VERVAGSCKVDRYDKARNLYSLLPSSLCLVSAFRIPFKPFGIHSPTLGNLLSEVVTLLQAMYGGGTTVRIHPFSTFAYQTPFLKAFHKKYARRVVK